MNILYDHQIFSTQQYGGISRYYYELIKNLGEIQNVEAQLSLLYSNNHYISQNVFFSHKGFLPDINFRGKYIIVSFINKLNSILILKKHQFDIFHPTYYDPYFLKYLEDKPFVLTIYDMIHETFPNFFNIRDKTSKFKKLLAHKAEKIIAISENTKKDITRNFGIDVNKISVVYLSGFPTNSLNKSSYLRLPEKFILFVGNRQYYKNFKILAEAFTKLSYKKDDLYLVCIGGMPFTREERKYLYKVNIKNRVIHMCLHDWNLSLAYKKAICFVFPSLYEGFGLPILEAFKNKCPAILANRSSFPEIAEDAALYFDPESSDSLIESIERLIVDKSLRDKLIQNGLKRENHFSWHKSAKQTLDVYRACCRTS
jgi:glycosyltransferase involved in cell wall biosynthesis